MSGNMRDAGVDLMIHSAAKVATCIAVNKWTYKQDNTHLTHDHIIMMISPYLFKWNMSEVHGVRLMFSWHQE